MQQPTNIKIRSIALQSPHFGDCMRRSLAADEMYMRIAQLQIQEGLLATLAIALIWLRTDRSINWVHHCGQFGVPQPHPIPH